MKQWVSWYPGPKTSLKEVASLQRWSTKETYSKNFSKLTTQETDRNEIPDGSVVKASIAGTWNVQSQILFEEMFH